MATNKAYTDLSQSKTLSKILPLESADMYWDYDVQKHGYYPMVMDDQFDDTCICAWSLAALLGVLPYPFLSELSNEMWKCGCYPNGICYYVAADSPIDACYELILKLNELNLL